MNVNEFLYHLILNLFTSSDNEKVYHFGCFDHEFVYHLVPKYRETLLLQNFVEIKEIEMIELKEVSSLIIEV